MTHRFDPGILREYDIRGRIGINLDERDAFALGRAFGTLVRRRGGRTVCIGYDGRKTSPVFANSLSEGLQRCGLHVTLTGLGPTPMLYFAVKHLDADAGIMVTGSHNPPDYNGFKMVLRDGAVYGQTIQDIGAIAAAGDFENGTGTAGQKDIADDYIQRLLQDFRGASPASVTWDNGNGAAGDCLRALTAKLPGTHNLLYADIDGTFPNHHPDPTVDANLVDLQDAVAQNKSALGIAFDGDGDRIGVIDENGTILRCDMLMALYAAEILRDTPGAAIIGDVKCSRVMFDEITRLGGQAVMWKTGHSLIKTKMAELKAPLAGELSGHIFFADRYYGYDDALYCAVRLLNIVGESGKPLSALTDHLPKLHSTPEIRVEVDESEKFGLIERIAADIRNSGSDLSTIDGVRVTTQDGWWLVRASNTQNALSARIEASSTQGLERLKTQAAEAIAKTGYTLDFQDSYAHPAEQKEKRASR